MSYKVTAKIGIQKYRTEINAEQHQLILDEPLGIGGKVLGPAPGEMLTTSIAACAAVTIKMYADRKGWDLREALIDVESDKGTDGKTTIFTKKDHAQRKLNGGSKTTVI